MSRSYFVRNMADVAEMLQQFTLIKQLNPHLDFAHFEQLLRQMAENRYQMAGVFVDGKCVGISGYWLGTKLYSGKYLEIDNFVIDEQYRSQRFGKILLDWLTAEAARHHCETIMLDAYVVNNAAHKFYLREGFAIVGFHFLKRFQ